jgi:hypothetical protein
MRIRLNYYGSSLAGDTRHAQKIMSDLGIKYQSAEGHPIGDCWLFDGVDASTVPADLPSYVEVLS